MGFSDIANIIIQCPYCGRDVRDFQTKNGLCAHVEYSPGDIVRHDEGIINPKIKFEGVDRGFYCTGFCVHRIEERDQDGSNVSDAKIIWIDVIIPVIDGVISEDRSTWRVQYEPKDHEYLGITGYDNVDPTKFNSKIKILEENARLMEFEKFKPIIILEDSRSLCKI